MRRPFQVLLGCVLLLGPALPVAADTASTPDLTGVTDLVGAVAVGAGSVAATPTESLIGDLGGAEAGLTQDRQAVPQLPCRPTDRPETGLQGYVPPLDVVTLRAAQGYTCNLDLVGRYQSTPWASLDSFEDCAYYGQQAAAGGVHVLDVSDPANPVKTAELTTPAMKDPGESMRVNAKRKLLVATGYTNDNDPQSNAPWLDIYDLSQDCRHPRLISSTYMAPAMGHEGWFSPDGMTYVMSTCCKFDQATTFPIDIRDPANPRVLASWDFERATHGGVTTEDSRRTYACQQAEPPYDAMLAIDSTAMASQLVGEPPRLLGTLPLEDNQWCQGVYRVTYDGRPHLIQFGERSGAPDCSRSQDGWATFGYPRFVDISDEANPRVVGRALWEVDLPKNCLQVTQQGAPIGLGYSVHHCSPDRLYNPTILACAKFHGGLRVLDIRDPSHPVEIAYYNPGVNLVLGTSPRPVIRTDRREIWFGNDANGFHVVRFAPGVWPFADTKPCPGFADYYFKHYNPQSTCRTASFSGLGKPAPGGYR